MKTPMTPTAQEVAQCIAHNFFKDNSLMKRACGSLWKNYRGNLKTIIAESLTTFAQARERAVWENLNLCDECRRKNVPEDHH